MAKTLRLLIIEDVEDHALLLVRELHKGGLDCSFERVETAQELQASLEAGGWDAIISDFNLPGFDGIDALRLVQEKGIDVPFLLVSGAIGEEKAAEVMRAGAHDYIRKGNYARLVPTLERELRDAKIRQERRQTAEELTRHREHLEELVRERTEELVNANQALHVEKQEREQALLQLEAVLENIREGVIIADLEGNVLTMNKEALALSEFEWVEQARMHITEFQKLFELCDLQGNVLSPQQWPLARALLGEDFIDSEYLVRRKDTGRCWIGSYSGSPVCNKEGDQCLVVLTMRDITAKKEAEEALRKSEAKFAKIFNAAPSLIGIISLPDESLIDINETALRTLGLLREEALGRTLEDLGIWGSAEDHEKVLRLLEQEGSIRDLEIRVRDKSGQALVGLLAAEIIELEDRRYMIGLMRDITERKRAEEEIARLNADLAARVSELEERNQELEAFNRMVSHDLRQPLNVAGISCQQLEIMCETQLDEECQNTIKTVYSGIMRMNDLIEVLLKFARSTHGQVRRESVDLCMFVRKIVEAARLAEPQRKVTLICPDTLPADGDPDLLRTVLENLVGNAWKYTGHREEGIIEVGATEVDGNRTFFVRDNGMGFDMSHADKLFVPFHRLPSAEEFKGSGIGLATVERIIRRHGGRIWAHGEPEKGATFYFTLGPAQEGAA